MCSPFTTCHDVVYCVSVRVCDSERMSDELMAQLADKDWKVRKEALDKVVAIVNEVKFITSNIGPLPEALKPRLTDSNKILVSNVCVMYCYASVICFVGIYQVSAPVLASRNPAIFANPAKSGSM